MFNRSISEGRAAGRLAFLHPAEHSQQSQNNGSHAASQKKNSNNNNMDFVNDFHIRTEVSSEEKGNHLDFARHSVLRGKEMDSMGLCLEYSLPPAVL